MLKVSARSSSPVTLASQTWPMWLWKALLCVWGTLLSGMVVGIIVNLNTITTDVSLSKLFITHLVLDFPIPIFSCLGLLVLLTLLAWIGNRERAALLPHALSHWDRIHILRHLHFRYEQMLEQSLHGAVQVELGLVERPASVQHTASLSLRLPEHPEHLLPAPSCVREAYEWAQQELLILGEPGSGKSTLLLELAHHLVQRAEQDAVQPWPFLLPLSSWAVSRRPLQEWLAEQVTLLYDVPENLSRQWVQAGRILPLLDGLDEMEVSAQPSCITAINAYHHQYRCPLVVCSRTNEYDTAARGERLALKTAVVVQPLSPEQVESHLANLGKPLTALRAALKKNPLFQTLATTPLLLQVLTLTYHGTPIREFPQREAQMREQIWSDYVRRMVQGKGNPSRYSLHTTCVWLGMLAREMRRYNQTIFSLEHLQPDWLPSRPRALYRRSSTLVFGLIVGLVVGLLGGLLGGLGEGPLFGLVFWLVIGPVLGMVFGASSGLLNGLVLGLLSGLVLGPSSGPLGGLVVGLLGGLLFDLAFGLTEGLILGLSGGLIFGLSVGLGGGLAFGLLFGLLGGLCNSLSGGLGGSLSGSLSGRLSGGLVLGLTFGLGGGLGGGLSFGLSVGLGGRLVLGLVLGLLGGLVVGLLGGLLGELLARLFAKLDAALSHAILRAFLWHTRTFPWRIISFLDDATTRTLLRRIDEGYGFTHRLLLDYFADAYPTLPAASLVLSPPPRGSATRET